MGNWTVGLLNFDRACFAPDDVANAASAANPKPNDLLTPNEALTHEPYANRRKIDPSKFGKKPDGTPDYNDRVEIGPTPLAFKEWAEAGLEAPNLAAMRKFRIDRLAKAVSDAGLAAVLLADPLNIRYASDTTNMQLWATHNQFRACLVTADGYMVVYDYKGTDLLTSFNPLVNETRTGAACFYFSAGDMAHEDSTAFAADVSDVITGQLGKEVMKGGKIGIDKTMLHTLRALEALGYDVVDGEKVMEITRSIKGPDEIKAMRCASHACEAALYEMERQAAPGMTENDVWAIMHAENIRRGGEWIETRIMSSGPRTNPWFQECGPRVIGDGEILAFDTDLIGAYGICVDISRTWWIGQGEPNAEQKRLYREAHAQIVENTAILKPGMTLKEVSYAGRQLPEEFVPQAYGCKMHGVGLCDEWPLVRYPHKWRDGDFDYTLEPGMALCVEAYIGVVGGNDGIKLEDQVLITEDGVERLTEYPFADAFLG